jgi:hypothetical protein
MTRSGGVWASTKDEEFLDILDDINFCLCVYACVRGGAL